MTETDWKLRYTNLLVANTKLHERIADLERIAKERGKQSDRVYFRIIDEYATKYDMTRKELSQMISKNSDLEAWAAALEMRESRLPDLRNQVKILHAIGMTPSEIDYQLGLADGTARNAMVDSWYDDKLAAKKEQLKAVLNEEQRRIPAQDPKAD